MPPLNLYARVRTSLCTLRTRSRVQRAPGLPCALYFLGERYAYLGRLVPRERGVMLRTISVIARSACDEAIQFLRAALDCFAPLAMTVLDTLFES
jgi:hypothetical protein